jgi:hypothetical protein
MHVAALLLTASVGSNPDCIHALACGKCVLVDTLVCLWALWVKPLLTRSQLSC